MRFKLFGITWDFTSLVLNMIVIVDPRYWLQLDGYCKEWDKMMRQELKNPLFTEKTKHTVRLNGKKLWIDNYPYGFGNEYAKEGYPSRKTCILLRRAMENSDNYIKKSGNVISINGGK